MFVLYASAVLLLSGVLQVAPHTGTESRVGWGLDRTSGDSPVHPTCSSRTT